MRRRPLRTVATVLILIGAASLIQCAPFFVHPLTCGEPVAAEYWGPEDLELDGGDSRGARLIVSAQKRRPRHSSEAGYLLSVPLDGPKRDTVTEFTREGGEAVIHPHGISLVRMRDGSTRLYVVDHIPGRPGHIDVFTVNGDRLIASPSLTPPAKFLPQPNDVAALENGDVYVTNLSEHGAAISILRSLVNLESGKVALYQGGRWSEPARRIGAANGIVAAPGGKRLYVAASADRYIYVYDVSGEKLIPAGRVKVGSGVDNLTWEIPGRTLLFAQHPRLIPFNRHGGDERKHAPSSIRRVDVAKPGATPEQVYGDRGGQFNAASVAVRWMDDLYLGQVFDRGVLHCSLQAASPPPNNPPARN
jgi:hypothetical protein